ncbi:MAG: FIST C-terminal domain-containing protein [Gemmatimonadaceae bacterium]|nr:FIST C-terminal domain-containing protein [Gemmatimonadaceae bacterium]
MTDIATASTALTNAEAGSDLARQIREQIGTEPPDAVLVFASSSNEYEPMLAALSRETGTTHLIGCSSAGEFTEDAAGTGRSSAFALRADDMRFAAVLATHLSDDRQAAAESLTEGFAGVANPDFRFRTAIVMVDALAGYTDDLVDRMTTATGGMYQFVGGGAGDDGNFACTHVFHGETAHTNAVVALEILSNKPIGIGARHGWNAAGDPLRVTESARSCVVSFNVAPAVEAFEEHAEATQQQFDRANPMPFFLHNIVGVSTAEGHKLRVPLGVGDDGSIMTASDVPSGATAHIMSIGEQSAADAASRAVQDAMAQVISAGCQPKAALFFDCVATRLRLGGGFQHELDTVAQQLDGIPFAGFNSYGQIVRANGQFNGFHNCTAVACVFPD